MGMTVPVVMTPVPVTVPVTMPMMAVVMIMQMIMVGVVMSVRMAHVSPIRHFRPRPSRYMITR